MYNYSIITSWRGKKFILKIIFWKNPTESFNKAVETLERFSSDLHKIVSTHGDFNYFKILLESKFTNIQAKDRVLQILMKLFENYKV